MAAAAATAHGFLARIRRSMRISLRQQVRLQPGLPQPLQGQAVGDREAQHVLGEDAGRRPRSSPVSRLELLHLADLQLQLLLQELLQAGQPEGVAQADHVLDLGVAVRVGEVAQRALHLADEVVEHRLERGRGSSSAPGDLAALRLRCSALAKVSFMSLVRARVKWLPPSGIGRCQMILPPSVMTRLRVVGADVEGDDALLALSSAGVAASPASLLEQVVGDEVAQGQRGHLHDVDLDVDVLEVLQVAVDHVALHGEQADLRLQGEAVGDLARADLLVVPDDLVER